MSDNVFAGGCSPFWGLSTALTFFGAARSRKLALENAKRDILFKKDIADQKEEHANMLKNKELEFQKELQIKRQYRKIEAAKALSKDLDMIDLQPFLRAWPLVLDVNTIIQSYYSDHILSMVIGRHALFSNTDPLAKYYDCIVEQIKKNLRRLGVKDVNVLPFKQNAKSVGGPALANVFAMMKSIPVIMLMPDISPDKSHIAFNVGIWNQDSCFPLCRKLFAIDYNEALMRNEKKYQNDKIKEIVCSGTTIFGVFRDTFLMLESGKEPSFPEFATEFGLQSYPALLYFACSEYESLVSFSNQHTILDPDIVSVDVMSRLTHLKSCQSLSSGALSKLRSLNHNQSCQ